MAVKTLDRVLLYELETKKISFLNLTINLAEYQALKGAKELIQQQPSIRICAAGWYRDSSGEIAYKKIVSLLEGFGLEVYHSPFGKVIAFKR